jgi:acyl-CoA reductase-like NAD-dependent aldehyde dehydrogenase
MLRIPVVRWGKPYESLETQKVVHFLTGEPIAEVDQANGGIVSRDLRRAGEARRILREFAVDDLIGRIKQAGKLFASASLPLGNGLQTPEDFVHQQSATTGLPEQMCRNNMTKNSFVMENIDTILDALTRGLDLNILAKGYGQESRGVIVSYQCQAPVLGAVLPSNSPGVHTLWIPVIALQLGLVLKPGSQEPWTAYRVASAFQQAGIPAEVFSLYPGGHDVGGAILSGCQRAMIFGGEKTIQQYAGNPRVQVHGPGYSKILLGDDVVDDWEQYLDLMVESIYINGGRSCINASSVWASRHTEEIAAALAERLGPIEAKDPTDPQAGLAAFTVEGMGKAVYEMLQADLKEDGVTDCTAKYGPRLVEHDRCSYLRPMIAHAASPSCAIATKEFMFPFGTVVKCPQEKMIDSIGYTLVGTAITADPQWINALSDATNIDRLNIGPIATNRLNWLQPHEGNLTEFLFRSRAYQVAEAKLALA